MARTEVRGGQILDQSVGIPDISATGTPSSSTFLRGDGQWAAPTASVTDPNQQSYTPGSFTIATGKYVIMSNHLQLTGTQRATLQGTSRLRIT